MDLVWACLPVSDLTHFPQCAALVPPGQGAGSAPYALICTHQGCLPPIAEPRRLLEQLRRLFP